MNRRQFFGLAAAAVPTVASPADVASIKLRGPKKVEVVYKSANSKPNGLQAIAEGLWQARRK